MKETQQIWRKRSQKEYKERQREKTTASAPWTRADMTSKFRSPLPRRLQDTGRYLFTHQILPFPHVTVVVLDANLCSFPRTMPSSPANNFTAILAWTETRPFSHVERAGAWSCSWRNTPSCWFHGRGWGRMGGAPGGSTRKALGD